MSAEPDSRRNFVKKSIVTTIALSQPTLFSGLVRATGGEGDTTGGSTTAPETTWVYETTFPVTGIVTTVDPGMTTYPPDMTTIPDSTYETTIPESTIVSTEKTYHKRQYQYRVGATSEPQMPDPDHPGQMTTKTYSMSDVTIKNSANTLPLGTLTLAIAALQYPAHALIITPAELINGVPGSKALAEIPFKEKGSCAFTTAVTNQTSYCPGPGVANFENTVVVKVKPSKLEDETDPWGDGESIPDEPAAATLTTDPVDDAAKNTSPSSGLMKLVAEWSMAGWTWVAAYTSSSTLKLTVKDVGEWSPAGGEGKTPTCVLIWGTTILKRKRTLVKHGGDPMEDSGWTPLNVTQDSPEGWSPWKP